MNVKLWQVILYPILVMLMVLGCVTVYQRETSIIQNQEILAKEISVLKEFRFADNKEIQRVISNELFPRLAGVEQVIQSMEQKKK